MLPARPSTPPAVTRLGRTRLGRTRLGRTRLGRTRLGRTRLGRTLLDQLMVLGVTAILLATTVRVGLPLLDAFAVDTASQEIIDLIGTAREHALAGAHPVAVRIDAARRRFVVHRDADTLARSVLPDGLTLHASRDSLAYAPNGLGYGAANLRIVIARGRSADTITVSRLGRVARTRGPR